VPVRHLDGISPKDALRPVAAATSIAIDALTPPDGSIRAG
jgi:hypothetical protein